jgi:hypothetical protein
LRKHVSHRKGQDINQQKDTQKNQTMHRETNETRQHNTNATRHPQINATMQRQINATSNPQTNQTGQHDTNETRHTKNATRASRHPIVSEMSAESRSPRHEGAIFRSTLQVDWWGPEGGYEWRYRRRNESVPPQSRLPFCPRQ